MLVDLRLANRSLGGATPNPWWELPKKAIVRNQSYFSEACRCAAEIDAVLHGHK